MLQEPTTADLVELTRAYFQALSRHDFDAATSFYAPNAVLEGWGAGDTFEGRTAIRRFAEDWVGTFEEYMIEPEEIVCLGDVVLAVVRQDARAAKSAGHLRVRNAHVFVWLDGVVARASVYADIDEARAAAERLAEERG